MENSLGWCLVGDAFQGTHFWFVEFPASFAPFLSGKMMMKRGDIWHTFTYDETMKPFRWNHEKNVLLKKERGISFEEVVLAIEADGLLDVLAHPNPDKYPQQSVLLVALEDYVYLVPFVQEPTYYFLKTIIPSRKATRDYLGAQE